MSKPAKWTIQDERFFELVHRVTSLLDSDIDLDEDAANGVAVRQALAKELRQALTHANSDGKGGGVWTMTKPAKWTMERDFYGHTYSMGRDGESIARVAIKLGPSAPEIDRVRLILRTLNAGEVAMGEEDDD